MQTRGLVLVVDDEEPLRVMLGSLLRMNGFRALLAGTSNDALRICARLSRPINLLVTDIQLPELSGFDLAAVLAIERPAMPVLFISGTFAEHDLEVRTVLTPGRDFLAKPFAPRAFTTKVERMLGVSQKVRSAEEPAHLRLRVLEAC
jgi:FixJ family two-component response regulator